MGLQRGKRHRGAPLNLDVRPRVKTTMDPTELSEDLLAKIRGLKPMSPEDWSNVLAVLTDKSRTQRELQPSHWTALQVRVTYDLVSAINRMDRTSAALARKLVILTWVLVFFTAALLVEPIVHLLHWIGS